VCLIYLGAADVHVFNLAKLGKSSFKCTLFDLAEDVLDVGALLVGINGGCTSLLLLVPSDTLPAGGLTLACRWGLVACGGRGLRGSGGGCGRWCRGCSLGLSRGLLGR
jgi:hypothetical protein